MDCISPVQLAAMIHNVNTLKSREKNTFTKFSTQIKTFEGNRSFASDFWIENTCPIHARENACVVWDPVW